MKPAPHPGLVPLMLACLLFQQSASAQSRQAINVAKLGPQAGERVPDFSLKDQAGETWTLQSLMGPKGLMLVFYRSADW